MTHSISRTRRLRVLFAATALVLVPACQADLAAAATVPAPQRAAQEAPGHATALLAGGCYWGMEAVFSHVRGVTSVISGFEGGSRATAQYDRVSEGDTGHAESVRITYDPRVIRYDQLLQIYFTVAADPTELNKQGPDTGTQYRGAIVPMNAEQTAVATAYLAQLRKANPWHRPIVTAIEPYRGFYPAEDYHQDFAEKNPNHGYIKFWDVPKMNALHSTFPQYWKPTFTLG